MTAVIEENRPYEHISIRHLGEVIAGVEHTTSVKVAAWAPAYEKYSFADAGGGTEVLVSLDTIAEYETYMLETYPKALGLLKALCEGKGRAMPNPPVEARPNGKAPSHVLAGIGHALGTPCAQPDGEIYEHRN